MLSPIVSPPRQPLVNGRDARQPQEGVGIEPTLSWTAPTIGVAPRYRILVYRIYLKGSQPFLQLDAAISTASTSLRMPPGILKAGSSYIFTLRANRSPGDDETRPNREHLGSCTATALTAVISP
jgi:hypothetical protein